MSLTTNLKSNLYAPPMCPIRTEQRPGVCGAYRKINMHNLHENTDLLKRICHDLFPHYVLNHDLALYLLISAIVISTLVAIIASAVTEYMNSRRELIKEMAFTTWSDDEKEDEEQDNEMYMAECWDEVDDAGSVEDNKTSIMTESSTVTLVPTDINANEQWKDANEAFESEIVICNNHEFHNQNEVMAEKVITLTGVTMDEVEVDEMEVDEIECDNFVSDFELNDASVCIADILDNVDSVIKAKHLLAEEMNDSTTEKLQKDALNTKKQTESIFVDASSEEDDY